MNEKYEQLDGVTLAEMAATQHNALCQAYKKVTNKMVADGHSKHSVNLASYIALRLMFERAQVMEAHVTAETWPAIEEIVRVMNEVLDTDKGADPRPVASA